MITLILTSDDNLLTLSEETFKMFSDEIAKGINEFTAKIPLPNDISISIRPGEGLRIHLKGFFTDSVEDLNWLIRHINPIIGEVSSKLFDTTIRISTFGRILQFEDIIFKMQPPPDTYNATRLDGMVPDDKIPDEYFCALSQQIMDDPVYLKDNPRINYNRAHLEYYIYRDSRMLDPFTRQETSFLDIIPNTELKKNIDRFMMDKLREPWFIRSVKHGSLFKDLPPPHNRENLLIQNLERIDAEKIEVRINIRN